MLFPQLPYIDKIDKIFIWVLHQSLGDYFNIKIPSYQYKNSYHV